MKSLMSVPGVGVASIAVGYLLMTAPVTVAEDNTKLQSSSAPVQEIETCRKYLPLLGTTVQVPCEGTAKTEAPSDVTGEGEDTCRKYLAAVGAIVQVPCEGAAKSDTMADVEAPEQPCDRLAGDSIGFEKLIQNKAEAVRECRTAVNLYSKTRRFKFQLARALHVSAAYEEAFQLYRPLAEAGHTKAMNNLGVMFEKGQSVQKTIPRRSSGFARQPSWVCEGSDQSRPEVRTRPGRTTGFHRSGELVPKGGGSGLR